MCLCFLFLFFQLKLTRECIYNLHIICILWCMHKHHNQNTTLHREYLHGKNIDHYLFSKEDEKNHHIFNVGRRLGQVNSRVSGQPLGSKMFLSSMKLAALWGVDIFCLCFHLTEVRRGRSLHSPRLSASHGQNVHWNRAARVRATILEASFKWYYYNCSRKMIYF